MPIPLIVMVVFGSLYVLWPAPKVDEVAKPAHSGVFAPRIRHANGKAGVEVAFSTGPGQSYTACAAVQVSSDGVKTIVPCADN